MNAAGQGCPLRSQALALLCWVGVWLCALVQNALPQTINVELRAVWGGGPSRHFAGSIKISDGTLNVVRNLSVQDDSVCTLKRIRPHAIGGLDNIIAPYEIRIVPHSASNFGGADLQVSGKPDSELEFTFQQPGKSTSESVKVKLKQVMHGRDTQPIDAQGSRLSVERLLPDRLRARVNDGNPILSPGDACALLVEGYYSGLNAGEHRVTVKLIDVGSQRTLQQLHQDVAVDETGSFSKILFRELNTPSQAGVYALDIGVARKRLISSLVANSALPERRVEFVVAPSEKSIPQLSNGPWQEVAQLYPAGVSWWDSLGKFKVPTVRSLTPLVGQGAPLARSIGSEDHQRRLVGDKECMVLAKGAWHAFPYHVSTPGSAYRLRITAPGDLPQQLVLSIQEPSETSSGPALRVDSAMIVEPTTSAQQSLVSQELVFWPKTNSGYVLAFNSDTTHPAAIAEIVLEQMDSENAGQGNSVDTQSNPIGRVCSLYMDKPLLTENFNASRRLEPASARELDCWQSAWQASERFANYTYYSGFNTATLTVACQGGAIYPSESLSPSPKFDSGLFLADGSQPELKDSVELVCRQFDARGLKLILALDVEGALPELEHLTERAIDQPPQAEESDLSQQATQVQRASLSHYQISTEGEIALRRPPPSDGSGRSDKRPLLYNPLDARVQMTLERVVRELAERYGRHACFAGVQINLSPRSHFNFAGDLWGYDEATIARFQQSLGSALPSNAEQRMRLLTTTLRLNYINYRTDQLSEFYERLGETLVRQSPGSRLVINPAKLIAVPPEADKFWGAADGNLQASDMLRACGVDCTRLSQSANLVLLRPQTDSPLRSPPARAWSYQIAGDIQSDTLTSAEHCSLIVQQLPTSFRLPDYDKANPLGLARPRTWLFPHAQSAGDAARRQIINRLYHHDLQQVTTGGWLIPMGQESAMRPLVKVLEQFPPEAMKDLALQGSSASLRARSLAHNGKTYIQLVNNASWSENVFVQLRTNQPTLVRKLTGYATGDDEQTQQVRGGEPASIQLTMPAYSLMGLIVESADVQLMSINSSPPPELANIMQQRMAGLQTLIDRAGQLNEQQTLGLRGGDFEAWGEDGKPLGWTISTHPSTTISQENELPHTGRACVRLENRSENKATAWIQSERIAIPTTGRLALEVWVRGTPGPVQPVVRLSLVGRYRDGQRFQRWHEFVSGKPASSRTAARDDSQLTDDWGRRPLVLLVPDVPSEDMAELNIAVDLIGQGTICVDDVRVYGMFLHPDEQIHLSGQMFVASQQMRQGDYRLADQLLHSFWANFLSTYIATSPAIADQPVASEARLPQRPAPSGPAWRNPNAPRFNQWQENLRNRWQR